VRIFNAYLRISLELFIGLLFCVCSPDFSPTRNPSTSSVDALREVSLAVWILAAFFLLRYLLT